MTTEVLPDRWFAEVDPRVDAAVIREALRTRLAHGVASEEVVRQLAERDRVAVGEIFIGPRAADDPAMISLALSVVDILERALSPAPVYRRLADLAGDQAPAVLERAVERHPDALWLVPLSSRIEGAEMGRMHLLASQSRASFLDTCREYARAGARRGLVRVAVSLRRVEPFVALAEIDDERALILATAHIFQSPEPPPVGAWLAAVWGPDPTRILVGALAILHARAPDAVPILVQQCSRWPAVQAAARGLAVGRPTESVG